MIYYFCLFYLDLEDYFYSYILPFSLKGVKGLLLLFPLLDTIDFIDLFDAVPLYMLVDSLESFYLLKNLLDFEEFIVEI